MRLTQLGKNENNRSQSRERNSADMKITKHVGEKFCGYDVPPYLYYDAGSDATVLFMHGIGELGPMDGSELYEVDRLGLPAMAKGIRPWDTESKGTKEFIYNIVSIQVELSFSVDNKFILQWLKWKLGSKVIGVSGLSLGGLATYNLWNGDTEKILDFIVPVCGYLGADRIPFLRPIPVQSWHGTLDTKVSYNTDLNFVTKYNATQNLPKIDWHPLEGVGHSAWGPAYSSPLLHAFIEQQIADALLKRREPGIEEFKQMAINAIQNL